MRRVLIGLAVAAWTPGALAQNTATSGMMAITNVTVIDGTGAAPRDKMMLILDGGRIEYVGRVGERSIPPNAQLHDMSGHVVTPGLIESHTHLRRLAAVSQARLHAELDRMLHGGIVTARVMGGDLRLHIEASRAAESGSLPSPDMYYAFNVKDSGVNFITIDVDSSEDIDAVVAQATRGGASAIKMAAEIEIRAPVMRRLADAAHQAGLRVWAHARVFPGRPIDVVRAGVDGVSHTCGFAWQNPDLDPARDRRDGPVRAGHSIPH